MNKFIPLYKEANISIDKIDQNMNVGLLYHKFFDQWVMSDNTIEIKGEMKQSWIKKLSNKRIGNENLIQELIKRRKLMIDSIHIPCYNLIFENTSRFVTGLGITHPIENGFTWHHVLGTPYLPGSSVKGIVKSYCINWLNKLKNDEEIQRIFGSPETSNKNGAGSVIFLDAIPYHTVELEVDITTPHYNKYYAEKSCPGDWDNPTPIPFLVVKKGQEFLFGLIAKTEDGKNDIKLVKEWLKGSLELMGAGAKTAVGFGRFKFKSDEIDIKTEGDAWLENVKSKGNNLNINNPENIGKIVKEWENVQDENLKKSIAQSIKKHVGSSKWQNPLGRGTKKSINELKKFLGE